MTIFSCPFCNAEAQMQRNYLGGGGYIICCSNVGGKICPVSPRTPACRTLDQARKIWNTRCGQEMETKPKTRTLAVVPKNKKEKELFPFGKNITDARLAAGLTQTELAKRLETDRANISRLESGRSQPIRLTMEKIAKALGKGLAIVFVEVD